MKHLLLTLLLSVALSCRLSALAFDNDMDADRDIISETDDNIQAIFYRFGGHNAFTIIIEDGDSLCNVSITDLNDRNVLTTYMKTPILKWAFENLDDVLNSPDFKVSETEDYDPYGIYELSVIKRGKKSVVKSHLVFKITDNEELDEKIHELELLINRIWAEEFYSKIADPFKLFNSNGNNN